MTMRLLFFITLTVLIPTAWPRELRGDIQNTSRALTGKNSSLLTPPNTVPVLTPAPVAAPIIEVGTIVALRLVDANPGAEGKTILASINNNTVLDLASFPSSQSFSVEAITEGIVGSVRFDFDTKSPLRYESTAPFAMCKNYRERYMPCTGFTVGFHTILASPRFSGTLGLSYVISFQIVNATSRPTSSPVIQPTSLPTRSPLPANVTKGAWIETNSNATEIIRRHEACFLMVGRKAYLVGGRLRGNNAIDIYDPVTRSWSKGTAPPAEINHAQCINVDGKIWIPSSWFGKYPREKNHELIFIYDPVTDSWSTKPGLPESRRRGSATAVLVGRKIYVTHGNIGGHETGNHSTTLGWLDYYDIDNEEWHTNLPDAPNPRDHAGGALVNGRICVAGGRNGGEVKFFSRTILPTDCYDPVSNLWTVEANIPYAAAGGSYGTTCDGKLIVAGGEGNSFAAFSNVVIFDGKEWQSIDSLNVARHGTGLAVDCVCNQIYIASGGGSRGGRQEIASVETYFPSGVDEPCKR